MGAAWDILNFDIKLYPKFNAGLDQSNPDILSHHSSHVYHGTLSRAHQSVAQPPPYQVCETLLIIIIFKVI